jgi:hypothetical protein
MRLQVDGVDENPYRAACDTPTLYHCSIVGEMIAQGRQVEEAPDTDEDGFLKPILLDLVSGLICEERGKHKPGL